ncbi:MAG TPA: polysaccharide deacetylase family protein [Thermoanaerobaculia bacterium]|jgi:peptidoglycan/xylan/chitin deacetylase (PgdA/CDA1 family)
MVRKWFVRSALAALLTCSSLHAVTREVAVTFDDLPANPAYAAKLLKAIRKSGAPAVGFVNENKLTTPAHTAVLAKWLAAGLELGNHTYSHQSLNRIDAEEFERDVVRGEQVTRGLAKRPLRWFRHPFLHTGLTLETKRRVESFLTQHGYRVAPVTLDNAEWIFAAAYEKATDAATRKRIGQAYVDYMDAKLAYYEDQSQKLFGRNIRHVLLVHGNRLNSDWFDDLAASMRKRGYRFITLDRAVEDEAYRSEDTFTGRGGISWIHRWALTAGKKRAFFAGEPTTPTWIQDVAGIKE